MNNNLQKIKYIILGVVFIFSGFLFTDKASALTYTYNCNDGGTINSVVSLNPTGPFSADAPSTFQANAQMDSDSCGDRLVYLTAQNNNGSIIYLISQGILATNAQTSFQSTTYTSPNEGGDYNVNFTTWVNEPIRNYSYTQEEGGDWGNVYGLCQIGSNVQLYLTRDAETEADATSRGVTKVSIVQPVFADATNGNTPFGGGIYVRLLTGDFLPGELQVPASFDDGLPSGDFNAAGACIGLISEGYLEVYYSSIQEFY
ncbi:MAG: hypothetical protein KBC44_03195 [Candidatus Pacebacteria bacterium]|nr:hypothetical protein [Candidatus Paceibacterota bacterium]MBP9839955.1 hypothetical protein [Candidatus Paceibacterota bacterium]MDQ5922373.1 hypothetical protein [Patescibacteria group bacterium]